MQAGHGVVNAKVEVGVGRTFGIHARIRVVGVVVMPPMTSMTSIMSMITVSVMVMITMIVMLISVVIMVVVFVGFGLLSIEHGQTAGRQAARTRRSFRDCGEVFGLRGRKLETSFNHHTIITHGFFGHGQVVGHALDFFVQRGAPVDVVLELAGVLDVLDAQEANAAEERDEQQTIHQLHLSTLSRRDRPRHGERGGNQHGGVGGPQLPVQEFRPVLKEFRVIGAVDRVGAEQAREQQEFGGQEQPHAQLASFKLLI